MDKQVIMERVTRECYDPTYVDLPYSHMLVKRLVEKALTVSGYLDLLAERDALRKVVEVALELMQAIDVECEDCIPDPVIYPKELRLRQALADLDELNGGGE